MNVDNFAPMKKANYTLTELEAKLERGCEGQLQSAKRRAKIVNDPDLYSDAEQHVQQTKYEFENADQIGTKLLIAQDCSARAYWLTGLSNKSGGSKGGNRRAINIEIANRPKHAEWQSRAEDIWKTNPSLSKKRVSQLIHRNHSDHPPANTVRKIIKNPTT